MAKVKLVCKKCGSGNILKDAYAAWSVEDQVWELHSVYDAVVCQDCGHESKFCVESIIEENEDA